MNANRNQSSLDAVRGLSSAHPMTQAETLGRKTDVNVEEPSPTHQAAAVQTRGKPMSCSRTMEIIRRISNSWRVGGERSAHSRHWLKGLLATVCVAGFSLPAEAQPPAAPMGPPPGMNYTMPYQDVSGQAKYADDGADLGVGGYGFKGRIGHEAGPTIGREQSITYFDLSPYMFMGDSSIIFGEGRLAIGNNGHVGGTAGGGLRHYFERVNSIAGVSAWYDGDDTRGAMFNQWGISTELLTEWIDWRTNLYFPFGNQQKILSERFAPGTTQFVDQNIVFQRRVTSATAMKGLDMMFTVPVPGELPEQFNFELSAGWYHFQAEDNALPEATGWALRADADVLDRLSHMFLLVTHDDAFDTRVTFGIDINYWHHLEARPRIGRTQYNRLAEWVRRNRTVVALEDSFLNAPEVAINPRTGLPYVVAQVRNVLDPPPANYPAPIGNGTIATPFQFIQEGINSGADIVFVQGNSVFDGTLVGDANAQAVLVPGVQVIGEGADITIPVQGLSDGITLPTVTPVPFDTPVIRNVTGPAVTLASDSRFAGINIENVTDGPAILANGITNAQVDFVNIDTVTGANAYGLQLVGNSGLLLFNDISITNTEDAAVFVQGGNANILFGGSNVITTDTGYAVYVEDAAGAVNLQNTLITDNGGLGIRVLGTAPGTSTAAVTFEGATLNNTNGGAAAPGVLIDNHYGSVSFTGNLAINGNNGDAFVISNLGPTGNVTVAGSTTITGRLGHGILVDTILEGPNPVNPTQQISGSVVFAGPVNINGLGAGAPDDPGIRFQSSSGSLSFLSTVLIDGSNGSGIEISNIANTGVTTGQFLAGGLIQMSNTQGIAFNVDNVAKQNFLITTTGLSIDDRLSAGINVNEFAGSARFLLNTVITNDLDTEGTVINVTNNTGDVAFQNVSVQDAIAIPPVDPLDPPNALVFVANNFNTVADPSVISFGNLDVTSTGGVAVSLQDNQSVSIGSGIIEADNGRGVEVINNARHNVTFTEINANGADYGILVQDSVGSFTVTGTGGLGGSGGLIEGMSIAGAQFINTQQVSLNYMDIEGNSRGIIADTILYQEQNLQTFLNLQGMNIDSNANQGILATNVANFSLVDSIITDNGVTGLLSGTQIELVAGLGTADIDLNGTDEAVTYNFTFDNNSIADATGAAIVNQDMILIRTNNATIGRDGATLNFIFTDHGVPPLGLNNVTSNRNGASALHVDWRGDVSATIQRNVFNMLNGNGTTSGANQTGVELDIDGTADIVYSNNTMSATGAGATGLDFNFRDSAAVQISDNVTFDANGNNVQGSGFLFAGIESTAVNLTFQGANNQLFFERNLIQFTGNGFDGTGLLVERIFGPSNVFINNNLIELITNFDTIQERGIYFQDVRGVINLNGNINNTITPGTVFPFTLDFFIPAGTSTGSIIVNGSPVP